MSRPTLPATVEATVPRLEQPCMPPNTYVAAEATAPEAMARLMNSRREYRDASSDSVIAALSRAGPRAPLTGGEYSARQWPQFGQSGFVFSLPLLMGRSMWKAAPAPGVLSTWISP